jgi:phosphatidylglycerol:prolipoprotein diacylglycerol transferase
MLAPHFVPGFLLGWSLGAVLGGGALVVLLRRAGYTSSQITIAFVTLTAALLAGSKAMYLAEAWPRWWQSSEELRLAVLSARMRIPGGLLLAILVTPALAWVLRVRPLDLADAYIPAAGFCLAGVRVGCFLEGCCAGTPSHLPWAVSFPPGSDAYLWQLTQGMIAPEAPATVAVHPLQLYYGLAGLLLGVGLLWHRGRFAGEILLLFVVGYFGSTYALELLQARPHDLTRHVTFLLALAGAVLVMLQAYRHGRSVPVEVQRAQHHGPALRVARRSSRTRL